MNPGAGVAKERVRRVMSLGIGVAAIIFGLMRAPDALAQIPDFGLGWTLAGALLFITPAALLAPLSFVAPQRVLAALAGLSGAGYLAASITAPLLLGDREALAGASPWPLTVSALATSVIAIWWNRAVIWPFLLLASLLVEVVRLMIDPSADVRLLVLDGLYTLTFNTVFVALALALRRTARLLDEATDAAIVETRRVASEDARSRERGRVAALVHDHLLVTLLVATDPEPRRRTGAAALARNAIALLEERPGGESRPLSAVEFAWRLQAVTTETAPDAQFSYVVDDATLPADAVDALLEATTEALRNSVRHAGSEDRAVARDVHVRSDERGFEVTVLDDGSGFDADRVPPERLGIQISIRRRMESVSGGRALIVSQPEVGTRVVLRWSAR